MNTLVLLLAWHALADFPLQGDYLAKFKNPWLPDFGTFGTAGYNRIWHWHMNAHCLIQAGGVYLITQNLWLAGGEYLAHFAIDYAKCRNWISFGADQGLHIACKFAWWGLA